MIDFAADHEIRKIEPLLDELFRQVATDYEPLFVSDETTIWDVSAASNANELATQLRTYYGVDVSSDELNLPLWKLLRILDERRKARPPRKALSDTATVIYVALLNESIDCWRPVEAIKEGENRYRIVSVPSDATEEWQFTNGDVVECETRRLWDGDALVALRRVE